MAGAQSKLYFVNPREYIIHASQTGMVDQIKSEWNVIKDQVRFK